MVCVYNYKLIHNFITVDVCYAILTFNSKLNPTYSKCHKLAISVDIVSYFIWILTFDVFVSLMMYDFFALTSISNREVG